MTTTRYQVHTSTFLTAFTAIGYTWHPLPSTLTRAVRVTSGPNLRGKATRL
jgi:hypothetical protein